MNFSIWRRKYKGPLRTPGSQGLDKISPTLKIVPKVFSEINLHIYLFTSGLGKAVILDLNFVKLNLFLAYEELQLRSGQPCGDHDKVVAREENLTFSPSGFKNHNNFCHLSPCKSIWLFIFKLYFTLTILARTTIPLRSRCINPLHLRDPPWAPTLMNKPH